MNDADYELRFAIHTSRSGRVEIRYFASPQDAEGTTIRLTPRERDDLAFALACPGFHAVKRDDAPDHQLKLGIAA
ncbi:MAG: hypothetical protein ABMA13_23015 [Chthoniobacteraceae bacterium]